MKSKDVYLSVGFDADQISNQLVYSFVSSDGKPPLHPTGLYEGEIVFNKDEVFHIRVLGSGRTETYSGFQVIDCCLITCPMVVSAEFGKTPRYAAPSPFLEQTGASYKLPLEFTADDKTDNKNRVVKQDWKQTLDVGNAEGRWKMSMYLTVRIFRGPDMQDETRVFMFDPETEVGSGRGSD
jgi:hypothetical protein